MYRWVSIASHCQQVYLRDYWMPMFLSPYPAERWMNGPLHSHSNIAFVLKKCSNCIDKSIGPCGDLHSLLLVQNLEFWPYAIEPIDFLFGSRIQESNSCLNRKKNAVKPHDKHNNLWPFMAIYHHGLYLSWDSSNNPNQTLVYFHWELIER